MKKYNRLWQAFYASGLAAIAVQQLICADFRPVIIPPLFPAWLPARLVLTWLCSIAFIAASAAIIFEIKARQVALLLGAFLLLPVLFFHIPYELGLYPAHLGVWTDPFKCLTLSGGALIVAGFHKRDINQSSFFKFLEKLIDAGKYFVAVTMVVFGIDHFLYFDFVATLVPNWLPAHIFWTYFAGSALILAGVAIIINIKRSLAAGLLGLMIFVWLIVLHVPRAIADPHTANGNEWTSVFEALAFSGISFLISANAQRDSV